VVAFDGAEGTLEVVRLDTDPTIAPGEMPRQPEHLIVDAHRFKPFPRPQIALSGRSLDYAWVGDIRECYECNQELEGFAYVGPAHDDTPRPGEEATTVVAYCNQCARELSE
jgi:hypothetical protein